MLAPSQHCDSVLLVGSPDPADATLARAAAWGIPSYSVCGWQRPCRLMSDGYAKSYRELVETTDWAKYGRGRDPRCANFMAHRGYEPTAMLATMGSLKQSLRALAGVQGPGAHDQEGADGMGMPDVTGPAAVVVWQARQQLA